MKPDIVITSCADAKDPQYRKWREGFTTHWNPLGVDGTVLMDDYLQGDPRQESCMLALECDPATSDPTNWKKHAAKWCKKVFALASLLDRSVYGADGWALWIDVDVEFLQAPKPQFFEEVCPDGAEISFLGRPWTYASETGFIAFNMSSPAVRLLLGTMREIFLSGFFRQFPQWGDAYTFDYCRGQLDLIENDLCAGLDPRAVEQKGLHVWPSTCLARYMTHHKGVRRKVAAYG